MALIQTRPYEEDLYVQLNPGDPGYIAASDLMYLVDHSSFTRPKRQPASNFGESGSVIHIEKDTLTGLSSASVSITFATAFSVTPIGDVKCYRMVEMPDGTYRKQDVLWGFTTSAMPLLTGFSLTISSTEISPTEGLTGIIVQYIYQ